MQKYCSVNFKLSPNHESPQQKILQTFVENNYTYKMLRLQWSHHIWSKEISGHAVSTVHKPSNEL